MISKPTLDPETFLLPFEGDNPGGADPRADMSPSSRFLQAKDARTGARRKERAIDVDGDAPPATDDWAEVADASCMILTEEGKDLEVAAWLIEALLRLDNLAGLVAGLRITSGLVENFWDTVYPLPDEDGNESRLSPFIALNGMGGDGTLTQPLRKTPLTAGSTPYGLWQYEQAAEIESISDSARREAKISGGALTMEQFMEGVRETPGSFFVNLLDDIGEARRAFDDLSTAFSAHVGHDAPPAGGLRGILQDMEDAVRSFARDKIAMTEATAQTGASHDVADDGDGEDREDAQDNAGATHSGAAQPGAAAPSGVPTSREDAFRQMLKIAAYFRQREPHSPISYSLEELVRRGRLPLHLLLEELIVDADARRYFFIASGIKPEEPVE